MYIHIRKHVHKYLCENVQCNCLDTCPIYIAVSCSVLKIIMHQGPCMFISECAHVYGIIQNGVEYTPIHSPTRERKGVFIAFRLR